MSSMLNKAWLRRKQKKGAVMDQDARKEPRRAVRSESKKERARMLKVKRRYSRCFSVCSKMND